MTTTRSTIQPLADVDVRHAMRPGVVTCLPGDRVSKLASIMASYGTRALLVSSGDDAHPLIITDVEVVRAALESDEATAAGIARERVATVTANVPLDHVVAVMAEQYVAHLLVTEPDAGTPSGIVSSFDVAAVAAGVNPRYARMPRPAPTRPSTSARTLSTARAREAMHPGIISCSADAPLTEVARSMAAHRIHCVAVIGREPSGGHMIWGLIADMDLVLAVHRRAFRESAATIAATKPMSVTEDTPLDRIASLMLEHATSHVVVVDESGLPAGMVSMRDIAAVVANGVTL